jgi:divalent metal cation (Fe/Co/Zn/Cd) transporter
MDTEWAYAFEKKRHYYKAATGIILITIFFYSFVAYISVILGLYDYSIALTGFGLYIAAEVVSGIGILNMIIRMRQNNSSRFDKIEKATLWFICGIFYLTAAALVILSAMSIRAENRPDATVWSMIVALFSITVPIVFMSYMIRTGRQLNSRPIIAEANRTTAGIFASLGLMISGLGFEVLGIGLIDSIGAVFISVASLAKGTSALKRIRGLRPERSAQTSAVLNSFKSRPGLLKPDM